VNLLDPQFYQHFTQIILAIIGAISVFKKLVTSLKSITRLFPRVKVKKVLATLKRGCVWLTCEMSLPVKFPLVDKFTEVMLTAIFYILTLNCFVLFSIDAHLIVYSDAIFVKHIAGICLALVILMMARWCLVQAEKSRIKLRATSRVIW